jgi:hypothetical protein
MILYHGSPHDFEAFTDEKVGNGHDQEGPGIYFSTDRVDANSHCRRFGYLYTVEAWFRKLVLDNRPARDREIETMIRAAPNLDEKLMDWDENYDVAFHKAMESIRRYDTAREMFQTVWYDFYRYEAVTYVRNMVQLLGYDAAVVQKDNDINHYTVFNPKAIKLLTKDKVVEY